MNSSEHARREPPARPGATPRRRWMPARMLRALSGAAAAGRQTRRGSFLVLVVGTLALMSVFAVVYIAIGRSDTGAAVGVQRNAARDNVPQQFADYVRSVIGKDVFARALVGDEPQPDTSATAQVRRETWDTPGMSPSETIATFSPVGDGTDPWLMNPFPVALQFAANTDDYAQYADLLSLSALAPDGAPVNLFNLRKYGFGASSQQMRESVTLIQKNGSTGDQTDFGDTVTASAKPDKPTGKPWYYWQRQRGMFRPTTFLGGKPDSPDHVPYQYAATQGSGMYDARLFELVEARTTDSKENKNLLNSPSNYRYFFAASVVDLNAFINVSTASDFRGTPTTGRPIGLTPADVDVRRMLMMSDFLHQATPGAGSWKKAGDGSYDMYARPQDLVPPLDRRLPANYEKYDSAIAPQVGAWAYTALHDSLTKGRIPKSGASMLGPTPFFYPDSKGRADFYSSFAGSDSSIVLQGNDYRVGAIFSADELVDLFAFRAWNNPEVTSALERITGSRYDTTGGAVNTLAFGPLRDNRTESLERGSIDINGDGVADPKARFALYANPRLYLTTANGARPLRSTVVGPADASGSDRLTANELQVSPDAGPAATFRVYADALIPFSDQVGSWQGEPKHREFRTQNYGYITAELGLQLAGNMAVNLDHMLRWDGKPRAYTVLVNESFRKELEADQPKSAGLQVNPKKISQRKYKQSWWVEHTATTGALDLGQPGSLTTPALADKSRLAHTTSAQTLSGAVNVFGVHPEPVLTSVAVMHLYTDAPEHAGGDKDGKGDPANGDPGAPVTINGATTSSNPDFLLQLIAFQLTNPYDVSIDLMSTQAANTASTAPYDYYFEYGDRYYRVGAVDRAKPSEKLLDARLSGQQYALPLGPGVTRTFFATNISLDKAAERVREATWDAASGAYKLTLDEAKTYVRNWIDTQLTVNGKGTDPNWEPVWIEPFSTALNSSGTAALNNFKNGLRNPYTDTTFYNIVETADKSADPKAVIATRTARLWRALRSQVGTTVGDTGELPPKSTDPLPEQFAENDLLVDRVRDSSTTSRPALDSRLPAGNKTVAGTTGYDEDKPQPNDNTGFSLVRYGLIRRPADLEPGTIPVGGMPAYMIESRFTRTLNTLSPDYRQGGKGQTPLDKEFFTTNHGKDILANEARHIAAGTTLKDMLEQQQIDTNFVLPYDPLGIEPSDWKEKPITRTNLASAANIVTARPALPGHLPADQFRAGDALLPLAMGPMQFIFDPSNPNSPKTSDPGYLDATWLTAGESMALATGYDVLPSTNSKPENKVFLPLYQEFGPFISVGGQTTGKTDRGQLVIDDYVLFYDKKSPQNPPIRPTFDRATTAADTNYDYRVGPGIPAALAALDGFIAPNMADYGSLTRSIPGRINVGTAPAPVLRALPLLAPTPETGGWWWSGGVFNAQTDIAATIVAYRDKVEVPYRVGAAASNRLNADFIDTNTPVNIKPDQVWALDGRENKTYVSGIRELPGIHSVGELGAARDVYDDNAPDQPDYTRATSIDYAGHRSVSPAMVHKAGVDSVLYKNNLPSAVKSSYADKLKVLSAISNSVTNRSDLFAVWFVLYGYQRSDVEGLAPNDPMIPSVQRRFFMVLDRSEVVKQGQLPRIVLMRELPM